MLDKQMQKDKKKFNDSMPLIQFKSYRNLKKNAYMKYWLLLRVIRVFLPSVLQLLHFRRNVTSHLFFREGGVRSQEKGRATQKGQAKKGK